MKIIMVILYISVIQVFATPINAQNVNLNVSNKSVREILKTIETQTHYRFFYNDSFSDLDNVVSIELSNKTVEESLDELLNSSKISYKVLDNNLIVIAPIRELMQLKVSGQVISAKDNLPIPGVKVVEKGTNNITVSDAKGNFSIKVSNENAVLLFSSIGFATQEVKVEGQISLVVKMNEDLQTLDEVVVIGYGTSLKSQLGGGSVGIANVKDMQRAPVKSFEDALAGRVAGVQVTSSEGGPLSANDIIIRGRNSITQNNSPLWVVDGFPMESSNSSSIDMSNIKSITVLKDAASTAIYGSRGANGVILITTNQGAVGAPVVTFNGYYGIQQNLKLMDMMDPYEYLKLQLERWPAGAQPLYTPGDPAIVAFVPGARTIDYYKTQPYINWQKELYRTAPMQNYSLSLSGGTDKSRYMISGSMTDQEGTIIASNFKRYQGRFVFNQDINRKTKFNLNVNYANSKTNGTSPSNFSSNSTYSLLTQVWGYRPAISANSSLDDQLLSLIEPDGQLAYAVNPFISTLNAINSYSTNSLQANTYLDYDIIKNLTLRVNGGLTYMQTIRNVYNGMLTSAGNPGNLTGPNGTIANSESKSLLNENTLTYKTVFNKDHFLNVLVGFSTQTTTSNSSSAMASQVPNDALGTSGLDEGTPYSIGASSSLNYLCSYFGRVMYNYKEKYFLTGVVRADGSSKFAPGNQWGYFPSASVKWNMAKEDFMKDLSFVSEFNFRGSYGISGNNRVNDFPYLSPINIGNVAYMYPFSNQYQIGAVQPTLGNMGLKWETTEATDIGLDFGIIENRVELVVDYYKKVTSNLLLQATLPGHMGYTTALKNIGSVSNTGWEFTLNTTNVTNKNFNWSSNFNISFNQNKVLALSSGQQGLISPVSYDTNPLYPYIAQVGKPISQIIGYKWIGNYQITDFNQLPNGTFVLKGNVSANGNTRTTIQPGDIRYEDLNGDGIINDQDKMVIGDPNPLFTGGFSNNFTYKGFDLNVLFSFSYGNDILNANRNVFESAQLATLNQFTTFENRWTPENPTNLYPRSFGTVTPAIASNIIEDGSFLRLKTIALGYSLPINLLQKINVRSARVYCSAQNIAVWSKYKGSDPEVSTKGFGLTQGFDYAAYPRSFTLVFGFNFSF